jgi:hypothetical protein
MRKLRLALEEIRVDSFRTSEEAVWAGTVRGNGDVDAFGGFEGEIGEAVAEPAKTLPPAVTCDTCYRTCVTNCTCQTLVGCTTCT